MALAAAADVARQAGYEVLSLGDAVTGEAREVAQQHAELARAAKEAGRRVAIISGGELSVTVLNANGRGGRSQEYALALAIALDGLPGVLHWRPIPTASTAVTARPAIPPAPNPCGDPVFGATPRCPDVSGQQ